jgi:iron complex outermembrane receptor protein
MSAQAQTAAPQTAAPQTADANPKTGTLQEVVVTAERRTTNVQKAAVSVAVISGKTLAAEGRYSLRQTLQNIVGVAAIDASTTTSQTGNDAQGNYITIRGVNPNGDPGAGPSVLSAPATTGVYIDGVYEGIGGGYDIQRVEVERGPQGTLFGRSATSGVYSVYTVDPVLNKYDGTAGIEYGNYGLRHLTGAVNIPLGDVLATRISADTYQRNGYDTGANGDLENDGARIKLLYKPSDQISALLGATVQADRSHNGGTGFTWPNPTAVGIPPNQTYVGGYLAGDTTVISKSEPVGSGHNHATQFWGQFEYNPGFATISFVPTYRTFAQSASQFTPPLDNYYLSQRTVTPLDHFLTYELRAASNEGSPVKWQAGTDYYRNDIYNTNLNAVAPNSTGYPRDSNGNPVTEVGDVVTSKRTQDYGVFGEATVPVFTGTRLTLGARYDWTKVDVQQLNTISVNFPFDLYGQQPVQLETLDVNAARGLSTYGNFDYKVRVEHDLTSHNMVYATVSTGFVPGNVSVSNVAATPKIINEASETLTAYELGSKNRFFDNQMQVNGDVYFYDYGGFQTTYDSVPGQFTTSVNIAVPAHLYGLELETLYSLTPADRVGVNFSYNQSHWVNMPAAFEASNGPKTLRPGVPYTLVANYDHTIAMATGASLDLHVDVHLDGPYDGTLAPITQAEYPIFDELDHVGPRVTADFNATWSPASGNYSITAYARNLANTVYTNPSVAPPPAGATVSFTDPRTMGLVATVRF